MTATPWLDPARPGSVLVRLWGSTPFSKCLLLLGVGWELALLGLQVRELGNFLWSPHVCLQTISFLISPFLLRLAKFPQRPARLWSFLSHPFPEGHGFTGYMVHLSLQVALFPNTSPPHNTGHRLSSLRGLFPELLLPDRDAEPRSLGFSYSSTLLLGRSLC